MPRFAADRSGARLVDGPGWASGPVEVHGRRVVGEVTLHEPDEVRARLRAAGEPVDPAVGDLELLARAYLRFGGAGLRAAEGMFTMALTGPDGLELVRDHVGARTAYHARTPHGWVAASALAALRPALPAWRTDLAAVATFLTFAYLPGPQTMVEGVVEAAPGRVTRLGDDGSVRVEPFWEPVERIEAGVPVEQHVADLRAELERATAVRLPPGAPVAVTLSGGIDSSLVTALAAKLHTHPTRTYSISFGDELPNELAYSGLVAAHCGTAHRVLRVSGRQVAGRLAETVALLDNPVGDPLTVPNLLLAEAVAGDGMAVSLNGEGGDPVFGGPKNLPMLIFEWHRSDTSPDARTLAYLRSYRKCGEDLPRLLTPRALAAAAAGPPLTGIVAPYLHGPMSSALNRLLHVNLRTKGAHHILPKVERLTAARGVQARSPLFDSRVIDLAFRVPPRLKLAGTEEKWVLKQAVADLLPDTIVRRPKSGMRVPVQQWLRGPLRDLAGDALLSRAAADRGLLRRDAVRAWLDGRGSVHPRHGAKLWLVLTLELWLRAHVDRPR
jgi:asparagine synthase (glutamine-hydrolysing)